MEIENLHRKKKLKTARNHQIPITMSYTLGNYARVSPWDFGRFTWEGIFYKKMARKMKISALIFVC